MKNMSKYQKNQNQKTKKKRLYNWKYIRFLDSSRQTNTTIPQQNSFTGKLEENEGATMFVIAEKQQKAFLKLFCRFMNCSRIIYTMKHKKLNLLNESSAYKFVTRNWNIASDPTNTNYSLGNEIIYSREVTISAPSFR